MALSSQLYCLHHTSLALVLFSRPACSSFWQISHHSGISNVLGSPAQLGLHLHNCMQCPQQLSLTLEDFTTLFDSCILHDSKARSHGQHRQVWLPAWDGAWPPWTTFAAAFLCCLFGAEKNVCPFFLQVRSFAVSKIYGVFSNNLTFNLWAATKGNDSIVWGISWTPDQQISHTWPGGFCLVVYVFWEGIVTPHDITSFYIYIYVYPILLQDLAGWVQFSSLINPFARDGDQYSKPQLIKMQSYMSTTQLLHLKFMDHCERSGKTVRAIGTEIFAAKFVS